MADDKKRRTWISIVVAVLIIFFILGVAIIGSAAFWFRRHINTQFTNEATVCGPNAHCRPS
jgi:hypothetical protein